MLHAAAAPWAAMSCLRPPSKRWFQPCTRCCQAAPGLLEDASVRVSHFTRSTKNVPLPIGRNSAKTPYIVCSTQTARHDPLPAQAAAAPRTSCPHGRGALRFPTSNGRGLTDCPAFAAFEISRRNLDNSWNHGATHPSTRQEPAHRAPAFQANSDMEYFNVRHSR